MCPGVSEGAIQPEWVYAHAEKHKCVESEDEKMENDGLLFYNSNWKPTSSEGQATHKGEKGT